MQTIIYPSSNTIKREINKDRKKTYAQALEEKQRLMQGPSKFEILKQKFSKHSLVTSPPSSAQ